MIFYLRGVSTNEIDINISVIYVKCDGPESVVRTLTNAGRKGYRIIESGYEAGKGTYIQFQVDNGSAMIVKAPEITGMQALVVHDDLCIPFFEKQ